jgi:hypothetical protein
MKHKYFLDESGNSGDLVKLPPDLKFANQPFFSLSCVGVEDCENLNEYINKLRKKHKVQGNELKSTKLYKSKPKFILDLFKYVSEQNCPFYVEVVDKKHCVAVSIINHQIVPPYFKIFDSEMQAQAFRNELSDYLAENLPYDCCHAFFEACINKSEVSVLKSMKTLRNYIRSKSFTFKYKREALQCIQNTIKFYHDNKSLNANLIKNLVPIPDINKKNKEIHLLPHVHSWFNLMAKVNKHHNSDLSEVIFYHDKQDHFDDILHFSTEEVKKSEPSRSIDPTVDFNIKGKISLEFPDSKTSSGVQLADVLAGFISRYVRDFLYEESDIDEIYHEIFSQLKTSYSNKNNFGVNFVLPMSRRNELFKKFNL